MLLICVCLYMMCNTDFFFPCQAVRLESVSPVRVRYLLVISTNCSKNESILLGVDFPNMERCVYLL